MSSAPEYIPALRYRWLTPWYDSIVRWTTRETVCKSSLFFHHLMTEDKLRTLREVRRVLAPGGELHVADWGRSDSAVMRLAFISVRLLDGFATTADNASGRLPELIRRAGFSTVLEGQSLRTPCGAMAFLRAM